MNTFDSLNMASKLLFVALHIKSKVLCLRNLEVDWISFLQKLLFVEKAGNPKLVFPENCSIIRLCNNEPTIICLVWVD